MKRKYLAIGLLASLTATSGFAFEENPAGQQNSPEESQFSVYDFGQGQQLAANSNSNDVTTIEGKNASGGNETTIIDENGNLKIVDKKANQGETNQPLQAGTQAPGELPPSPPGTIPIQSAQNATTPNATSAPSTSYYPQPATVPANPSSGQILTTPSQPVGTTSTTTPTTMNSNSTLPQPMNQAMPPAGQQMNQPLPSSGSQMNMPANTSNMAVPSNQSMTGTGGQPSNGNNFSQ